MGIVRKNFVIVATMIATTSILLLGLLYFALPVYYTQAKKQNLRTTYLEVVKQLDGLPKDTILEEIERLDKQVSNMFLSLYAADRQTLYPSLDDETARLEKEKDYLVKEEFDEIGSWTNLIVSKEGEEYYLFAEYGFHSLSEISQTLVTFYPFVLLFIFLLAIGVAFIYSRLSTKRLTIISETTRQMQSLEAGLSCPILGKDEVATLAQDINSLYDKLQSSIEELRQENDRALARDREKSDFLRITSHELKTPIASMLGLVEGMLYNVGPFKDHDTYLKQCLHILQEQSELVHSILEATNLDMAIKDDSEIIQLDQLIETTLKSYYSLAAVQQLDFDVSMEPTSIQGNGRYLLKAIKNILDNAFRYSKVQGRVRLLLADQQLIIENQVERLLGPEELEQIFRPFYRPDFSRNRKDGGTGIGLFIVQQILETHGFAYQFQASDASTMRFLIQF